jgi:hypothetical protein
MLHQVWKSTPHRIHQVDPLRVAYGNISIGVSFPPNGGKCWYANLLPSAHRWLRCSEHVACFSMIC